MTAAGKATESTGRAVTGIGEGMLNLLGEVRQAEEAGSSEDYLRKKEDKLNAFVTGLASRSDYESWGAEADAIVNDTSGTPNLSNKGNQALARRESQFQSDAKNKVLHYSMTKRLEDAKASIALSSQQKFDRGDYQGAMDTWDHATWMTDAERGQAQLGIKKAGMETNARRLTKEDPIGLLSQLADGPEAAVANGTIPDVASYGQIKSAAESERDQKVKKDKYAVDDEVDKGMINDVETYQKRLDDIPGLLPDEKARSIRGFQNHVDMKPPEFNGLAGQQADMEKGLMNGTLTMEGYTQYWNEKSVFAIGRKGNGDLGNMYSRSVLGASPGAMAYQLEMRDAKLAGRAARAPKDEDEVGGFYNATVSALNTGSETTLSTKLKETQDAGGDIGSIQSEMGLRAATENRANNRARPLFQQWYYGEQSRGKTPTPDEMTRQSGKLFEESKAYFAYASKPSATVKPPPTAVTSPVLPQVPSTASDALLPQKFETDSTQHFQSGGQKYANMRVEDGFNQETKTFAKPATDSSYGAIPQGQEEGLYMLRDGKWIGVGSAPEPTPDTQEAHDSGFHPGLYNQSASTDDNAARFIAGQEGFEPRAKWDYKQHSVGYGTKARFPGETITREEGLLRLNQETQSAKNAVVNKAKRNGINLTDQQVVALTSFAYNVGSGKLDQVFASGPSPLDWALTMKQFRRADGQILHGLEKRRKAEAALMGVSISY